MIKSIQGAKFKGAIVGELSIELWNTSTTGAPEDKPLLIHVDNAKSRLKNKPEYNVAYFNDVQGVYVTLTGEYIYASDVIRYVDISEL